MDNNNLTEQFVDNAVAAKKKFEGFFGKNKATRSAKQWRRLVHTYGKEAVMRIDNVSEDELGRLMNETFTQKLKRQFNGKVG